MSFHVFFICKSARIYLSSGYANKSQPWNNECKLKLHIYLAYAKKAQNKRRIHKTTHRRRTEKKEHEKNSMCAQSNGTAKGNSNNAVNAEE